DNISLPASVLYKGRKYGYYLIGGEVYYHEMYARDQYPSLTQVLITGIKRTINNTSNYAYEIQIIPLSEPVPTLMTSTPMTIAQVYDTDLTTHDIRRDYIELYGKLGFDSYLDMFYVEDL